FPPAGAQRAPRPSAGADGDPGDDQLVSGPQWRRKHCRLKLSKQTFGLVKMAGQKQAPDFEVTRMRGIQAVSMSLENRPRASECLGRPGKVTRDERDLSFGDDAARPRHCLSWT